MPTLTPKFMAKCKLVVWDFDKTVLRIHSFGERIRAGVLGCVRVCVSPPLDCQPLRYPCLCRWVCHHHCNAATVPCCFTPADHVRTRDMDADFCDLQFFIMVVKQLRDAGVAVAIASIGLYNVIQVRSLVDGIRALPKQQCCSVRVRGVS